MRSRIGRIYTVLLSGMMVVGASVTWGQSLQERVAALEAKLAAMSLETIDGQPAVVFEGVNVHIRNGAGATDLTDGTGNLVIGYNLRTRFGERAGSHNLILGDYLDYGATAYGGLVSGYSSRIDGPYAVIVGGQQNEATGTGAVVVGGMHHAVSEYGAVAIGRCADDVQASRARIDAAAGTRTSAEGGHRRSASGLDAMMSGGLRRRAAAKGDWMNICSPAADGGEDCTYCEENENGKVECTDYHLPPDGGIIVR